MCGRNVHFQPGFPLLVTRLGGLVWGGYVHGGVEGLLFGQDGGELGGVVLVGDGFDVVEGVEELLHGHGGGQAAGVHVVFDPAGQDQGDELDEEFAVEGLVAGDEGSPAVESGLDVVEGFLDHVAGAVGVEGLAGVLQVVGQERDTCPSG